MNLLEYADGLSDNFDDLINGVYINDKAVTKRLPSIAMKAAPNEKVRLLHALYSHNRNNARKTAAMILEKGSTDVVETLCRCIIEENAHS
jgi:hypothetical protein